MRGGRCVEDTDGAREKGQAGDEFPCNAECADSEVHVGSSPAQVRLGEGARRLRLRFSRLRPSRSSGPCYCHFGIVGGARYNQVLLLQGVSSTDVASQRSEDGEALAPIKRGRKRRV